VKNEETNIQTADYNGAGTVVYAFNSNCIFLTKWNYGVKHGVSELFILQLYKIFTAEMPLGFQIRVGN
jgi:hypothetical protein